MSNNLKKFLVSSGNWSKVIELSSLPFDKSYDMAIEAMTIATELFLHPQRCLRAPERCGNTALFLLLLADVYLCVCRKSHTS